MKRSLQLNPIHQPGTWADIKHWRDVHEVAPVATSMGTFDATPVSDERMARSIRRWTHLQTLDAQGKLHWKLADNSYQPMTQSELETVYNEIDINRTSRSSVLHLKAALFDQQTVKPTPAQLSDISFWLN